ncbi:threonine aldolase family protein [Enorma phocaeensis]|uniref:threonine aldolase family protein n=1 Tax=Enorma phocaeensis TaxID=1871019 RepID=UPI000C82EBC4|nr:beta-eliminating lyase-related protein [Enorma phocaeensis]
MQQYRNDYSEGAAPQILNALVATNAEQTPGYGTDEHCARAAELIRAEIGLSDAVVRFVPGGTAANIIAIASLTDEFEGPICAADAHPMNHEVGAIQATGRRLIPTDDALGVVTPDGAERAWRACTATGTHNTRPAMVYASDTTELGHVWTASEFDALCNWADGRGLAVYVDGARMASAIAAAGSDLDIAHIARRATAFTLGGTKNGMLFGEALVIRTDTARGARAADRLPYLIKRTGSLTAKGRLMGVMFEAAFDSANANDAGTVLYWQLAQYANRCATMLADGLESLGWDPVLATTGNQQFFWVNPDTAQLLNERFGCEPMDMPDPTGQGRTVVRFVTSWATDPALIEQELLPACRELIA